MANVSAAGGGAAGVTVSTAVLVAPPKLAELVAEVDAVTDTVVTVNVALVRPAGPVTLPTAGTLAAAGLLLERVTTTPPAGAAALRVTVATEELPPTTLVGFSAKPETVRGGGGARGGTASRAGGGAAAVGGGDGADGGFGSRDVEGGERCALP